MSFFMMYNNNYIQIYFICMLVVFLQQYIYSLPENDNFMNYEKKIQKKIVMNGQSLKYDKIFYSESLIWFDKPFMDKLKCNVLWLNYFSENMYSYEAYYFNIEKFNSNCIYNLNKLNICWGFETSTMLKCIKKVILTNIHNNKYDLINENFILDYITNCVETFDDNFIISGKIIFCMSKVENISTDILTPYYEDVCIQHNDIKLCPKSNKIISNSFIESFLIEINLIFNNLFF